MSVSSGAPFVFDGVEWRRVRVLGKGSFGEAHLVRHATTGEHAVCKLVHTASMSAKEKEDARGEVVVLAKLRHPNIVQYKGSFERNGMLHILMEYCNAGDVEQLIKKQRGAHIAEETVASLFVQMAQAIKYLHERKILHRDLKTANVFLTQQRPGAPLVAKIGDFGISTVLRHTFALAKTICGTPYFFSPELCLNKPYNNKSDIWSLGLVLYELCTLKHAFDATSMKALMSRILKGTYTPVGKPYSASVQTLLSGMLEQRAAKRLCIQQVLTSEFVLAHTKRLYAALDSSAAKDIQVDAAPELSGKRKSGDESRAKPVKIPPAPAPAAAPRRPPVSVDDRVLEARKRRDALEREAVEKRLGPRSRSNVGMARHDSKVRVYRQMPLEDRHELERLDDIRARVEMASYEDQLPFVQQGWRVAQEVKLHQDERQRQLQERDRHLEALKQQMELVSKKMGSATDAAVPPLANPVPVREPSAAQLARAYKDRVSADAPWNRNRDVPVGFTRESWEQHQQIMNRFGHFGENPIDAAAAKPLSSVRPDEVHQGRRKVQEMDLDALLDRENGRLMKEDPARAAAAERDQECLEEQRRQRAAEDEWRSHLLRIRAAEGLPADPALGEAELAWLIHKRKIDDAHPRSQQQAGPSTRYAHFDRDGGAAMDDDDGDDENDDEAAQRHYEEYDRVIAAMREPSGLPEPPEMFEDAELPANDITRLTNMAKFTLDGRTLHLPSIAPDDPLALRVEGLRAYLTEMLGGPRMYQYLHDSLVHIQNSDVDDDAANTMLASLETEFGPKACFVDLMIQLMVCESTLADGGGSGGGGEGRHA